MPTITHVLVLIMSLYISSYEISSCLPVCNYLYCINLISVDEMCLSYSQARWRERQKQKRKNAEQGAPGFALPDPPTEQGAPSPSNRPTTPPDPPTE